ncbi:MAG: MATE family efflux transporter [Lachnospiraceae bacterium]|nr:MATE family efflux transporter [Lachnospiraceae bacterium]
MENELFEKTPVPKAYFKFALPVVLSMVVSLVYNMVDTYFIAQTGNTNLVAGVSLSAPVFTLMIALGDIFGLGGSSVISRLFGEKKDEDGKRLSVFCFYAAIVCGIVVTAVMMLLREPILYALGADVATFSYASGYYTYIVLGAPFIILSFTPSNLLRTEGFATATMTGSILGAVVNMILDPVFISVLGLGAAGAAIATVIGNIFADAFYVWFLLKKSRRLSINLAGFHIHIVEVEQILAIGIPASITNLMQSIGIALTNRSLLPYGNDKVAAMGIVMKVNLIAVLILVGFAFGAQPLVGYNYGAKNHARLKEILRFSYGFECCTAAVLAGALSLAAPAMIGIFMQDKSIIEVGVPMLRMQQMGMVFTAVVLVTTCTFQSAGKAVGAFLLSVSRQGVLFAVVLLVASKAFAYQGVLMAQPVSDLLTAVMAVILFEILIRRPIGREQDA